MTGQGGHTMCDIALKRDQEYCSHHHTSWGRVSTASHYHCGHLELLNGNPGVRRKSLHHGHQELETARPVDDEQHFKVLSVHLIILSIKFYQHHREQIEDFHKDADRF